MKLAGLQFIFFGIIGVYANKFYPTSVPLRAKSFSSTENAGFRSLLVDDKEGVAYVGAQSTLFKLQLFSSQNVLRETMRHTLRPAGLDKSSFKDR